MAYELYKALELPASASPDEIRRAYYLMVRKHPPEKDPERFQEIRRAYETLSDEKARRDYDALQEHGDEISGLYSQAVHLMEQGHWETAAARLKHVLVLAPGNQSALNSLGVCLLHAEKFQRANEVYRDLVREHPDIALYQFNLGISLFEMAEAARHNKQPMPPGHGSFDELYAQARGHFVRAVELQPHNPDHYIAVARTFIEQGNYAQAMQWAEKAAGARGKTDHHDFEALFWICLFQLRMADLPAVERTAQRIAGLMPAGDDDVRRFAAFRFARIGIDLYENKAIEPAVTFFRIACQFDPEDGDLRQMFRGACETLATCDAFDRLMEDEAVISPLKRLSAVCMALFFEEKIENIQLVMEDVFNELDTYPMHDVLAAVRHLRKQYPQIIEINPGMFGDMERIAAEQIGAPSRDEAKLETAALSETHERPEPSSLAARLMAWMRRLGRRGD
jgi:tetratricopeptide (TPR) repeat protein